MRKLLWGLAGLLVLLVAAGFLAPLVVDGNSFKPRLIAQAREATGRDVEIAGPVSFALLPTPRLSIADLRLGNVAGGQAPRMAEIRSVEASLALLPLLGLRIEIAELTLFEPRIFLEQGSDGRGNWNFAPARRRSGEASPPASSAGGAASADRGMAVAIDRLRIVNGQLAFTSAPQASPVKAERIDLDLSVPGRDGPYAAKGSLQVNGTTLAIDLRLGGRGETGLPVTLSLAAPGGQVRFDGRVSELSPAATLRGRLDTRAENLTAFLVSLHNAAGMTAPDLPAALQQKFSFEGTVEASAAGILANDMKLALGEDSGQGSLTVALQSPRRLDGRLSFKHLDLDRWLDKPAAPTRPAATEPRPSGSASPSGPSRPASALPADLGIKLSLSIDELVWNSGTVRRVAMEVEADKGRMALNRLEAQLPGEARLQARSSIAADTAKPEASGTFDLAGPRLRETLSWLKVDVARVPAARLGNFAIKGKLLAGTSGIRVGDAEFRLDDTSGRGSIAVSLLPRLAVALQIEADQFDADSYLPARSAGAPAGAAGSRPGGAASTAVPDLKLDLKLARLVWQGERIEGIDVEFAYGGDRLTIAESRIASAAGASITAKGSIVNPANDPKFDLVLAINAADPARLLRLAGAEAMLKGRQLGAVALQGAIAGTSRDLTLNGFSVSLAGARLLATGKVGIAASGPKYNLTRFEFQTADSAKLMATLGLGQRGDLGAVSMTGSLAGDHDDVTFKGDATVKGLSASGTVAVQFAAAVPRIDADLRTSALELDRLIGVRSGSSSTAGANPPPAQAGASGGGRFSRTPIDASALRAFDGNIKLQAASLSLTPWKLENAEIEFKLQAGVLSIDRFAGRMFGGLVASSGTVNASKEVIGFDLRLTADDVDMGGISRTLAGGGRFDGTMDASFELRGAGASMADIIAGLNGGGKLSGSLRLNASAKEQMLGNVAGVAGKQAGKFIDRQLGGTIGGRVRSETLDLATALKIVLDRFANRNGPAAATLAIQNGVVTTGDMRLDGSNAWALTTATVSLPAWSLESLTNIYVAEDPAQPCLVVRQRGSIDSPSRSVDRGPSGCGQSAGATPQQQPGLAPNEPGQTAPQQQQQQQKPTDPVRRQLRKIF